MEKICIQSFCGDYEVFFDEAINYDDVIKTGDVAVVDKTVYEIYQNELSQVLSSGNTIIIDATENQKSYEGLIPLIDEIIKKGFHKNNALIAIGGGITQDCVAFVASILYRGVSWRLIPTTLLAQCDSCIGSKVSINFSGYKNQLGGFYPPRSIYISSRFLKSLNRKEILSGLGEMLHYFVVGGEDDFTFFAENYKKAQYDAEILQKLIRRSLEIKKSYIEIDEYDRNERQIFNYGHSFGHAIEAMTNYRVPHGIAVSYGMDIANYISVEMGMLDVKVRQKIREITETFWSDGDIDDFDIDSYISQLHRDKKNKGNKLGIILCSGFGKLAKYMIDADDKFCKMISDYFAALKGINHYELQ